MELKYLIISKIKDFKSKALYATVRKMEVADYYDGKVDGFECTLHHFGEPDFKDMIGFGIKIIEDVLETNKDLARATRRNFEGKIAAYREVLKMVA